MPTFRELGVVQRGPRDPQQVVLGEGVYVQSYRGLDGPVIQLGCSRGRVVRHRLCRRFISSLWFAKNFNGNLMKSMGNQSKDFAKPARV
jgi:hypothetical protein